MFSARKAATSKLEPFDFENLDGEPRQIPHVKTLSVDQGQRILADGDLTVIDEIAPGMGTEISSWPAHVVEEFTRAWMAHSGIVLPDGSPGKSSTYSPSSPSTGRPSKRTSRSAASRSRR